MNAVKKKVIEYSTSGKESVFLFCGLRFEVDIFLSTMAK